MSISWHEEHERLLLRHVAAGDTTAFEQLYQHYAPRLAAFLRPRLTPSQLVEEVLNEVMLVVWQRAAEFQPACSPSAWLFGIARYKARKARRRWHQEVLPEPSAETMGADQNSPERLLRQQERYHIVAHALVHLPPEQRTVVELTYFHACSAREIAERLGEPEPTVRSRLRLARQRLARRLARQGFD
jgi:RNA polymerase sigma-70 factor (ECF subfamily)